jgi:hypothetical protein
MDALAHVSVARRPLGRRTCLLACVGLLTAFDVAETPPPMREWSPYETVHAPHLSGNMRSRRGEFRLVALADGRTRLEGTTWYELDMFPQAYWGLWSDALIHTIHTRVLGHIKHRVEAE